MKRFFFLLFIGLGVYFVDANLNFPIARPQVLVVWAAIMSLLMGYYQKSEYLKYKQSNKTKLNKLFLQLEFYNCPKFYVTNQVYKSLKGQMFLLQDFNTNQYNFAS